jgi:hypothetical protein
VIPYGDSDIPTMMADMGEPISIGNTSGIGIVNRDDLPYQSTEGPRGIVVMPVTTVIIQTSAFPGIAVDDSVFLNGKTFQIANRGRIDDGALMKLWLGNAGTVYDGGFFTDTPGSQVGGALFTPAPTDPAIDGGSF